MLHHRREGAIGDQKGARWFVARLAIGGGLRGSTRLKKGKDRSSEAVVSSDEKKETKPIGAARLQSWKELRRGKKSEKGSDRRKKETRRTLVILSSNRRMRRRNNRGGLRVVVCCPTGKRMGLLWLKKRRGKGLQSRLG
ncbi:unnamed protein product [Lactuca saligna]|uniref:Uncharacterized protein n=1 Tax=Lactuca saligna TaxID=75948 RepID=A0AA35Z456_LACSI|nr:unnamed protein product [Lactuca saligna]